MQEFRIEWQQRPHVHHARRVMFVEADSPADAEVLAVNHIERRAGLPRGEFSIHSITVVAQALPAGRVKEGA